MLKAMKSVAFTGTRDGMSPAQRTLVEKLLVEIAPSSVVHGDCVGADADFHDIAKGLGLTVYVYPGSIDEQRAHCEGAVAVSEPMWPTDRNPLIVEAAEVLIACPSGRKELRRGSGTWATVRHARRIGRRHLMVYPDGGVDYVGFTDADAPFIDESSS